MYALLTSQSGLPIVVSTNSNEYWHLQMAGYNEEAKGHKRAMQDKADEILAEMGEIYIGDIQQD